MRTLSTNVLVIGAGPAGLAAASALRCPFLMVEAHPGGCGLSGSFEVGGATFDYGGHAFFTTDGEVRRLLTDGVNLHRQPRRAVIWSNGCFLPYPYQTHLAYLPPEVAASGLEGFVHAWVSQHSSGVTSLQDWIMRTFGAGIARDFLIPYNEKVWAYPIDQIVPLWAGARIVTPNLRQIIEGAVSRRDFAEFPNAIVDYPEVGGFRALFAQLQRRAGESVINDSVIAIDIDHGVAETAAGLTIKFRRAISTMPLDKIGQMSIGQRAPLLAEAATNLVCNQLALVSLVLRTKTRDSRQRVYVASNDVPFHKLVLNHNSSDHTAPEGMSAFQAEVSFSTYKPLPAGDIVEHVLSSLNRMQIITPDDALLATDVRYLQRAYPIYTHESIAAAQFMFEELLAHRIAPVGRFGEWAYINSDTAVRRGLDAAEWANSEDSRPALRRYQHGG